RFLLFDVEASIKPSAIESSSMSSRAGTLLSIRSPEARTRTSGGDMNGAVMGRILVAGIGNMFLGDDAFGVAVAARLRRERLGERGHVVGFGIRGVHLPDQLPDRPHDPPLP